MIDYERDSDGTAVSVPRRDPPDVVVECKCGHSWTEGPEFSIHEPIRCPKCHWFGRMEILKEVP